MRKFICAVCGAHSEHKEFAPAEDLQPPDFDTRPGEPLRSNMDAWMHSCPSCGYAAGNLEELAESVRELVLGAEYQRIANDTELHARVRPFVCHSWILEQLYAYADAGWCMLHAAWVCDDLGAVEQALICRERCIELWKEAKMQSTDFMESHLEEFAVISDLHRRLGQFEEAHVACEAALDTPELPWIIVSMLRAQLVLLASGDRGRHSLTELLSASDAAAASDPF